MSARRSTAGTTKPKPRAPRTSALRYASVTVAEEAYSISPSRRPSCASSGARRGASERLGRPLERLAPEAAAHEVGETLVSGVRAAREDEVERHAQLPAPGEEGRDGERAEVRRREEQEALRQGVDAAVVDNVRAPLALARADQRHAEALAQLGGPRLLGQEGVRARLDREPAAPLGRDRAAQPLAGLEQHAVGHAALDQPVRRSEPGHAAAHHGDARAHAAAAATTSASMRMKRGWSFTVLARAKPRPDARAVARASTSRS